MTEAMSDNNTQPEPGQNHKTPLRACLTQMLENYFRDLDGHHPGQLYDMVLGEVEHAMLETILRHTRGNQTRAAGILGISRGTLRKKLTAYGLDG